MNLNLSERRKPLQLQEAVQEEIERLLKEGYIERVTLEARALNIDLVKDKYQMPNLEHLVDELAEQLDKQNEGKAWYTSIDT